MDVVHDPSCHITRQIPQAIERVGFVVNSLDTYYMEGEAKPFAYTFEGRATKA